MCTSHRCANCVGYCQALFLHNLVTEVHANLCFWCILGAATIRVDGETASSARVSVPSLFARQGDWTVEVRLGSALVSSRVVPLGTQSIVVGDLDVNTVYSVSVTGSNGERLTPVQFLTRPFVGASTGKSDSRW